MLRLAFTDEVTHCGRGHHYLVAADPALAARLQQKALGDDGEQRKGELDSDLVADFGREDVDEPGDGFRRVGGVQGADDQVA